MKLCVSFISMVEGYPSKYLDDGPTSADDGTSVTKIWVTSIEWEYMSIEWEYMIIEWEYLSIECETLSIE